MSERKVNLEEILHQYCNLEVSEYTVEEMILSNSNAVIIAMKEACRQTLELAAENAKPIVRLDIEWSKQDILINKQSILDTINQIE